MPLERLWEIEVQIGYYQVVFILKLCCVGNMFKASIGKLLKYDSNEFNNFLKINVRLQITKFIGICKPFFRENTFYKRTFNVKKKTWKSKQLTSDNSFMRNKYYMPRDFLSIQCGRLFRTRNNNSIFSQDFSNIYLHCTHNFFEKCGVRIFLEKLNNNANSILIDFFSILPFGHFIEEKQ